MRSFKFISLKLTPGKKHAAAGVYDPSCPYKIIDSENFIKVSQNPNKVARYTQGLPIYGPAQRFWGAKLQGFVDGPAGIWVFWKIPSQCTRLALNQQIPSAPGRNKRQMGAQISIFMIAQLRNLFFVRIIH